MRPLNVSPNSQPFEIIPAVSRKLLVLLALCLVGVIVAYRAWGWDFNWSLFLSSLSSMKAGWLIASIVSYNVDILVSRDSMADPSGAVESGSASGRFLSITIVGILGNLSAGKGGRTRASGMAGAPGEGRIDWIGGNNRRRAFSGCDHVDHGVRDSRCLRPRFRALLLHRLILSEKRSVDYRRRCGRSHDRAFRPSIERRLDRGQDSVPASCSLDGYIPAGTLFPAGREIARAW